MGFLPRFFLFEKFIGRISVAEFGRYPDFCKKSSAVLWLRALSFYCTSSTRIHAGCNLFYCVFSMNY